MLEGALKVFAGSSNPELTRRICENLDIPLGDATLTRFSDGELYVEIGENVRNADIFVVQSTSSPANDHIMELVIMIDALKRSSASSICAVIPYYGYGRQDRKVAPRTPITAKLVCDLIEAAGATRILAIDLHAGQIQGFFDIPFDHLFAMPVLLQDMWANHPAEETVLVSPDAGGVERARAYSKRHGSGLAIIDKRRPKANVAEVLNIIGEVDGRDAVLIDDIVDTAGTLTNAATALLNKGARRVVAYATHGVLSGPAIQRLEESAIEKVVVTDTVPLNEKARECKKIKVLSVAPLLSKALRRIHQGDSVSSLFV
ncbi:MAG: phosphoribosylpyrophosphate synthetase [Deltaproteobacteria bacterium RIFOXYA12_FULL_58_15]|nr:MAG: phosphoribosylpyrophosphate synthetase [Deltaproteobacteria bacterium RIFOXYA12_FULL_58_15]OGR09649.1 MAG: phosphoribosylpyrophosphate synthetase [Deltaproteobacteria bacterium RIFOXYB12_FULL_58_9]